MSINSNVIVIDAHKSEQKKLKVCAYVRVSTNSEDQLNSFKTQLKHYQDYITANNNWELIDIYADEGLSGTSASNRKELQRLLADCRRKKINKILIKSLSRFARNTKESLEMIRELRSLGISIFFEKENIDTAKATDEFLLTLYSQIAQEESISLSENLKRSLQSRMERGKFITYTAPFGYDLADGELIINKAESEVIRYIFASYLSGKNTREIASELTIKRIPNKKGSTEWCYPSIRYILRNEKYVGDSILQKTYTPYVKSQSIVNKGQQKKYYLKNSHKGIVDRDIFERAQELSSKNKPYEVKPSVKNPISGKMVCFKCGSAYKTRRCRNINYWICNLHDKNRKLCTAGRIKESEINKAFVRMFNKLQIHKKDLIEPIIDVLSEMRAKRNLNHQRVSEINNEAADLLEQIKVINELKSKGYIDSALFISQSNDINRRLKDIKEEKSLLMVSDEDDIINGSKELIGLIEDMPTHIEKSNADMLPEIVEKIIIVSETEIQFQLINKVCFTEYIERTYR
jgi:site-specific DNA recombinase